MRYDIDEIKARVARGRRGFIIRAAISLAIMLGGLVFILLSLDDTLTFLCFVIEFAALFYLVYAAERASLPVLFSGELQGVNIKEDEYSVRASRGPALRYRQEGARSFGGPPIAPSTGANKRRTPPAMRSAVYLRKDDGSIVMLRGLYLSHTNIYEDGDRLLKHAGTKYPIIIGRQVTHQPCPMCGEVNEAARSECRGCGLPIYKENDNENCTDSTRQEKG